MSNFENEAAAFMKHGAQLRSASNGKDPYPGLLMGRLSRTLAPRPKLPAVQARPMPWTTSNSGGNGGCVLPSCCSTLSSTPCVVHLLQKDLEKDGSTAPSNLAPKRSQWVMWRLEIG